MIVSDFDVRKAAQVAAYFARAAGGRINGLKLVNIIYLADREFAARYDEPMIDDHWVSMDHGPVNSGTLNMVNGMGGPNPDWDTFIGPRVGFDVALARNLRDGDLDELSVADLEVLSAIWEKFSPMSVDEVRDYTHMNCPEWEHPQSGSTPIPYARVFKFLGKEGAEGLAETIESVRAMNRTFKRTADACRDLVSAV